MMLVVVWSAPFKTSEERKPKQIMEIVNKQVKTYFGEQDFTGVPLLDPKIEWNILENWPDQITFQGETTYLQILDMSHGDYSVGLKSKADVKPGMSILAVYHKKGSNKRGILDPSGYWETNGCIHDKILNFNWQTVFGYKYYTSGRILMFSFKDYTTNESRREVFDRKGNILGVELQIGQAVTYKWKGRKLDEETFWKRANKLLNNHQDR
jgi:hypothetical protein